MAMQTWREASVENALSEREQQHTIERIVAPSFPGSR